MTDGTRIVLADPEGYLLEEIADPAMRRIDIAKTYRLILASGEQDRVNWRTVNTAVIDRWSESALDWIKKFAWKDSAS
jgi:hypothetical protein